MRPRGTPPTRDVTRDCARAGRFALALGWFALASGMAASCGSTVDSLGYDDGAGKPLGPLKKPTAPYPNPFRDRGHSDADIASKINLAFASLFHGDLNHAIYVSDGTDAAGHDLAHILDVFHNDVRTEGIGLGMLIAVELDHRDELDALWTFTKAMLRVQSGSQSGYFNSFCENNVAVPVPCLDPFGLQQMTMALILANDRYTLAGAMKTVDYAGDAWNLLTLMRHKVDENGGVKDGVTDTFDHATSLVYDQPLTMYADVGRPSIEMPGYYELWAQATGDPFWTMAAKAARDYWRRTTSLTTNLTTGLIPVRATFEGVPLAGSDGVFASEAYRAQIAMVLDQIWTGGNGDDWGSGEADRLLGFFTSQGQMTYGMTFTLDGTVLNLQHDTALEAANGVSATIAKNVAQRNPFIDDVWKMDIPMGANRYFSGLLYLVSLLVLGGQMQVL